MMKSNSSIDKIQEDEKDINKISKEKKSRRKSYLEICIDDLQREPEDQMKLDKSEGAKRESRVDKYKNSLLLYERGNIDEKGIEEIIQEIGEDEKKKEFEERYRNLEKEFSSLFKDASQVAEEAKAPLSFECRKTFLGTNVRNKKELAIRTADYKLKSLYRDVLQQIAEVQIAKVPELLRPMEELYQTIRSNLLECKASLTMLEPEEIKEFRDKWKELDEASQTIRNSSEINTTDVKNYENYIHQTEKLVYEIYEKCLNRADERYSRAFAIFSENDEDFTDDTVLTDNGGKDFNLINDSCKYSLLQAKGKLRELQGSLSNRVKSKEAEELLPGPTTSDATTLQPKSPGRTESQLQGLEDPDLIDKGLQSVQSHAELDPHSYAGLASRINKGLQSVQSGAESYYVVVLRLEEQLQSILENSEGKKSSI